MKVQIQDARISFAHGLFEASAMEPGQTPKFGADFLLVPGYKVFKVIDNKKIPTTMEAVMLEVANETWKGKGKEMLAALESSKKCLRDGSTRLSKSGDVYDGYDGLKYVAAKNTSRPLVIDRQKSPITAESGKLYSGCFVHVSFDVYGKSDPKKKGVHASLKGVQFSKDGDAFGGGGAASPDEFEDLGEGANASFEDEDSLV